MSWCCYLLLAVAVIGLAFLVLDRIGGALQRYEIERDEWNG